MEKNEVLEKRAAAKTIVLSHRGKHVSLDSRLEKLFRALEYFEERVRAQWPLEPAEQQKATAIGRYAVRELEGEDKALIAALLEADYSLSNIP